MINKLLQLCALCIIARIKFNASVVHILFSFTFFLLVLRKFHLAFLSSFLLSLIFHDLKFQLKEKIRITQRERMFLMFPYEIKNYFLLSFFRNKQYNHRSIYSSYDCVHQSWIEYRIFCAWYLMQETKILTKHQFTMIPNILIIKLFTVRCSLHFDFRFVHFFGCYFYEICNTSSSSSCASNLIR